MAGGGVQEIYGIFLGTAPAGNRSGRDLFHLRDGFEIKMNFNRNVSCLIAVDVFMDNDFFNQTVEGGSVQLRDVGVFPEWRPPIAWRPRQADFPSASFLRPCSTRSFSSACSFCVLSSMRLKFASLIRPATMSS